MKIEKKWSIRNTPNSLSDNQLKHVFAGYGEGSGSGKKEICCRYADGRPGCTSTHCVDSCDNQGSKCGTSGTYTCYSANC